jgi:hypothetical protein
MFFAFFYVTVELLAATFNIEEKWVYEINAKLRGP